PSPRRPSPKAPAPLRVMPGLTLIAIPAQLLLRPPVQLLTLSLELVHLALGLLRRVPRHLAGRVLDLALHLLPHPLELITVLCHCSGLHARSNPRLAPAQRRGQLATSDRHLTLATTPSLSIREPEFRCPRPSVHAHAQLNPRM